MCPELYRVQAAQAKLSVPTASSMKSAQSTASKFSEESGPARTRNRSKLPDITRGPDEIGYRRGLWLNIAALTGAEGGFTSKGYRFPLTVSRRSSILRRRICWGTVKGGQ